MLILTTQELFEIYNIIDYFHLFFIADTLGTDLLSKSEKDLLISYGIDIESFENEVDYITYAYKFGILASALKKDKVENFTFDTLKSFISSGHFIPLTTSEKLALKYVRLQTYHDIKGLGNRIKQSTGQIIIESSKRRRLINERAIRRETKSAIKNRKSVKDLSSALAEKTKDYCRDFDRIADYVMHDAYSHGIAGNLLEKYGEDVEVFFSVYPKACKHCVDLYLTDGIGSEPKVFKLKDVIANGSNIGRKAKDYVVSVSPVHPQCRCTIGHKPENTVWDDITKRFILARNTYGVERKSKIKVTIKRS